ncbi:MAG: SDR family NAD(P)-dependent oxidoreductase [Pseudomonadota bacterium]
MKEKSVLITGCSSGIGQCLAVGLQARGYRVFAGARKPEDVSALAAQGLEAVRLDLDDSASIRQAVQEVLARGNGQLYALINNAGYGQPGAVEDLTRAALRAQFETNVFGALELTNLVLPVLRAQGHGRVITISSLLGLVAFPYRGAYNASKFALEGLMDTLRLELRDSGVHAALIEPGPTETRFRSNALAAYRRHAKTESNAHAANYARMEQRLIKPRGGLFSSHPRAVLKKVIHALESAHPCAHYYVGLPTHFVALLRRVLPGRMMDWAVYKMSRGGAT